MSLLARLFKFERPPAEALTVLGPDERLTGWGLTSDGDAVLATTHGLWLPGQRHLPWHTLHKATWDQGVLRLIPGVEVAEGVVADGEPIVVQMLEPRDLPAEVRTRVTRSVAYSSHHPLPGGGVRIVARRVPGVDGLTWALRFDAGVDPADETLRAAADELLVQARALSEVP